MIGVPRVFRRRRHAPAQGPVPIRRCRKYRRGFRHPLFDQLCGSGLLSCCQCAANSVDNNGRCLFGAKVRSECGTSLKLTRALLGRCGQLRRERRPSKLSMADALELRCHLDLASRSLLLGDPVGRCEMMWNLEGPARTSASVGSKIGFILIFLPFMGVVAFSQNQFLRSSSKDC